MRLPPAEYRESFPGAELMAETIRAARTRNPRHLPHWESIWSWEYILDRAKEFHRRGWGLDARAVSRRERNLYTTTWHHGRQWDEVICAIGLNPEEVRNVIPGLSLTKEEVIEQLQQRGREGHPLDESRLTQEDMRLVNAARRRFGSHSKALRAAGFKPAQVQLRCRRWLPKDHRLFEKEMRAVAGLRGQRRRNAAERFKSKWGNFIYQYYENLETACQKFDLDFRLFKKSTHYESVDEVLHHLRKLLRQGLTTTQIFKGHRDLYSSARHYFGPWRTARAAALAMPRVSPRFATFT